MKIMQSGVAAFALLAACATEQSESASDASEGPPSLLARSSPSAGATVANPGSLGLEFREPVRLVEVTVTGADGMAMPMMVSSAGEQTSYTLPLHGLEPGAYTVRWRALVAGVSREGSFPFVVRNLRTRPPLLRR